LFPLTIFRTPHLLKGIKEHGDLTIESMLKQVRPNVKQETIDKPFQQIPWENTSLDREFGFSQSGCQNVQTPTPVGILLL
jgi:uncharacterized caspase-like protein